MKVDIILEGTANAIPGTNCANCLWAKSTNHEKVSKDELNKQGGLKITDKKLLKLAKKADLITLPGSAKVTDKFMCKNSDVDQFVTKRMCCAYWDNDDCIRDFKREVK